MWALLFGEDGWTPQLLHGFLITMLVAFSAYASSFVVGIAWSMAASSRRRLVRSVWKVYASMVMGVPPLLVIFFVYYNLPVLLSAISGLSVEVTPMAAGITALAIVYSAYLGEAFRGAYLDISARQFEAARSLGLKRYPMYRIVILPQVLRLAAPALSNIWLIVLKDTAYVSLVGLTDIVRVAYVASGTTNQPFLFFIASGAVFVLLAIVSAYLMRRIEERLDRPYRQADDARGAAAQTAAA